MSAAAVSAGSLGRSPVSCCASVWTALIHRSSTSVSAPPSGFVFVDRLLMSSRYVASPCPRVPWSLRSGERSASATINPRSIT